jgi:hypothetical protein
MVTRVSRTHRKWRGEWKRRRLRKRVIKALTLAPRGAVANDRLHLGTTSLSLKLDWQARDVHPWDGDLPVGRRRERFTTALIADTVTAIRHVFEQLAEVDVLQIRVFAPNESRRAILAGTVCRDDLNAAEDCRSPAMSLKLLGVQYHLADG